MTKKGEFCLSASWLAGRTSPEERKAPRSTSRFRSSRDCTMAPLRTNSRPTESNTLHGMGSPHTHRLAGRAQQGTHLIVQSDNAVDHGRCAAQVTIRIAYRRYPTYFNDILMWP